MKLAWAGVLIGVAGLAVLIGGCGDDHNRRVTSDRDRGPGPAVHHRGDNERLDGPKVIIEDHSSDVIVIKEPPPPRREEVRPLPPSREHVWIGGYYDYDMSRRVYIWKSGHYDKPPHKGAVWMEDKWERGDDGYHHQSGHWK